MIVRKSFKRAGKGNLYCIDEWRRKSSLSQKLVVKYLNWGLRKEIIKAERLRVEIPSHLITQMLQMTTDDNGQKEDRH